MENADGGRSARALVVLLILRVKAFSFSWRIPQIVILVWISVSIHLRTLEKDFTIRANQNGGSTYPELIWLSNRDIEGGRRIDVGGFRYDPGTIQVIPAQPGGDPGANPESDPGAIPSETQGG
jgi:hypothetical protein